LITEIHFFHLVVVQSTKETHSNLWANLGLKESEFLLVRLFV
jgi:hypothetical protein